MVQNFGFLIQMNNTYIIDILNPEVIVIGSIFARSHNLLWKHTKRVVYDEVMKFSADCCKVFPS